MNSTAHSTMETELLDSLKNVIGTLDCENSDEKLTSLSMLAATFEKLKH